ncbi:hypothetical protein C8R44DRAFT_854556 [Mycena epipterygia]|nr:hypothetical protein C8R44DRAFT_854556 [Mycena epipterygia]
MSGLSLSLPLASAPPTRTTTKLTIGLLVIPSMTYIIHLASPLRLTRVLVAAISNVEKTYLEAVEAGMLSRLDVHTAAMLSSLQIKVSHIRATTLRNSLSYFGVLCDFQRAVVYNLPRHPRGSQARGAHRDPKRRAPARSQSSWGHNWDDFPPTKAYLRLELVVPQMPP